MPLPEFIIAIRTITYDTQKIRESWYDLYDDPANIKDEDIMAMINDWAQEDLGGEYRLLDEDGNEL